jgi:hypothetical protein
MPGRTLTREQLHRNGACFVGMTAFEALCGSECEIDTFNMPLRAANISSGWGYAGWLSYVFLNSDDRAIYDAISDQLYREHVWKCVRDLSMPEDEYNEAYRRFRAGCYAAFAYLYSTPR